MSFGGKSNTSLDVACPTAAALTAAYQSVISAYNVTTIDLDVEGTALDNFGAETRRAQAIATLEQADPKLNVWLTFPVEKNGLQSDALSVLASMLHDHVTLAGINIMTMDYTSLPAGTSMGQAAEDALNATATQLATVYPQYGIKLSTRQIWQRLGATVMIGQNDQQGQNFSVADAQSLVSFANANHLGRLLDVVHQQGRPVRLDLPGDRAAVQHVQRHDPDRSGVHPDLRRAEGRRGDPAVLWQRAAGRAGHQPGGRAVPAVVGERELPARLQGRGERRDLPGQVVQHRRRPLGAGAVRLAVALGAARPGGAWRGSVGRSSRCRRAATRPGRRARRTTPATRCSTRDCRTRPSGPTRESPRRPRRPTRRGRRGRRSTRSPASRAAHPPSASPRPPRRARRYRRHRRRRRVDGATG